MINDKRTYTIYVCSLCGSDDIMSNSEDSYCNDCRLWMNGVALTVQATQTLDEALAAVGVRS